MLTSLIGKVIKEYPTVGKTSIAIILYVGLPLVRISLLYTNNNFNCIQTRAPHPHTFAAHRSASCFIPKKYRKKLTQICLTNY